MSTEDEDAANIRGEAPGRAGLLLIDVINPMNFPGAEDLAPRAVQASEAIRRLRDEADALAVPVVYLNDNYGHWESEKGRIVEMCAGATPAAAAIIDRLRPREGDFFVVKPQFSGFYATNLPVLLPRLGVSRVVITGFAAEICVLFTAADAHMREYELWIPEDAVASEGQERSNWALDIMRQSMKARVDRTDRLDLTSFVAMARP